MEEMITARAVGFANIVSNDKDLLTELTGSLAGLAFVGSNRCSGSSQNTTAFPEKIVGAIHTVVVIKGSIREWLCYIDVVGAGKFLCT